MKRITYFLLIVLTVFFGGCRPEENPVPTSTVKISVPAAKVNGYNLAGEWYKSPFLENSWHKEGATFQAYIIQDELISSAGKVESLEQSISDADRKSALTVEVPIPQNISRDRDYRIILVDNAAKSEKTGGAIVFESTLKRGVGFIPGWYMAEVGSGHTTEATAAYLTSSECLFVKNTTSAPISVKHKGYSAYQKWYYTDTKVKIKANPTVMVAVEDGTQGEESVSEAIEIQPGEAGFIITMFTPNGKKMTDASLVLEIDGKQVQTEPVSSDVEIENGVPYFMTVAWDGSSLKWYKEGEEPEPEQPALFDYSLSDSEESEVEVISYDYDNGTLELLVPEEKIPQVGDIVCSGITDEAPYGYIMQVANVERTQTKITGPMTAIKLTAASVELYEILKLLNVEANDVYVPLHKGNVAFVDEEGNTIYKEYKGDAQVTLEIPISVKTENGDLELKYTNSISVPQFDFYFDASSPNLKVGFHSVVKSEAVTHTKLEGRISKKGDMYKEFCDKTGNKNPYIIHTREFMIGPVPLVVTTKLKPSMPYELSLSGKAEMDLFKKTNYYHVGGVFQTITQELSPIPGYDGYCQLINPDDEFCDYPTRDFSVTINGKASWGFDVEYSMGLYGGNIINETFDELKEIANDYGPDLDKKLINFSNCRYLSIGTNWGFKLAHSFSLGMTKRLIEPTDPVEDSKTKLLLIDDSKYESYLYGKVWGTALDVDVEINGVGTGLKLLTGEKEWKFLKSEYHLPFFFPIMAKMKISEDTHQSFINITAYRYAPLFSGIFTLFKELDSGYLIESADGKESESFSLEGYTIDKDTRKCVFAIPKHINDYRKNVRYYVYPYIRVANYLLGNVEETVYREGIYFTINNEGKLSSSTIEDVPGEDL